MVPFHIILLEPSHDENIYAWECILEGRSGDGPAAMFNWDLAGEAFNASQPPGFLVMLNAPLPPAAAVVLASGEVLVPDTGTEILFYLHPFDPPSQENPPDYGYPVWAPLYAYGEDLYQPLGWTSGCEAEPVARINDDGEDPIWSLGELPQEIIFGAVPVGEAVIRNITITNTGEVAISGQIGISGDGFMYCYPYDPGMWTTDLQWFRIEPGHGRTVRIRLESATDEGYVGALNLILCGETTTIVLIKQLALYSCSIEPGVLDLGEIDLYAPGPWEGPVEVTNDGTLPLGLVVDEDCPDFVFEYNCGLIPPGDSCNLWVTFDPSELGPQECAVTINDGLCELMCTAVVVEGPPQCFISPPGWDFGNVWAGNPAQQSLEVINVGGPQLEGQVTIPESCSGFTVVEGAESFSLAHDEIHYVTVEFDPAAWGFQECHISVSADCPDVALSGIGLVPDGGCWYYQYGDPPIFGSVDTPGSAGGVAVSDSFAYVADGESGLLVIDISNPTDPNVTGSVGTSGDAGRVAILGNYTYVATDHGLAVVDVTDPTNPQFVVGVNTGFAADVAVAGDFAYVTGGSFKVIDISDPRNPWIAAVADTTVVYASSGLAVTSGYAYVTVGYSPGSVMVLDITNPFNPLVVNSLPYCSSSSFDDYCSCNEVAISGDYLYVTGSTMENFGDPFHPIWFSTYLRRFDISTPENPVSAGGLTRQTGSGCLPGQYGGGSVTMAGNIAYVTSGGWPGGSRLEILDGLSYIGQVEGWSSSELVIGGDFIYSAVGPSGMYVLLQQCGDVVAIDDDLPPPESDEEIPSAGPQLAVHPNPFNPRTTITFSVEKLMLVKISVYDLTGRLVSVLDDRTYPAGKHLIDWNGRDAAGRAIPSGAYIVRMVTESGVEARKVMLIR